jgi:regulator of cell morphogenesis and NO signaling
MAAARHPDESCHSDFCFIKRYGCLTLTEGYMFMNVNPGDTVDDLVSANVEAAKVLSKHGIDFCSEGSKTLKEACGEAGVTLTKLVRELTETSPNRSLDQLDASKLKIGELTRYIETYHHHYTIENITFIKTSLDRLVRFHADQYPELIEIKNTFEDLTGPLMVHMQHEEFIVFPYIRQLAKKGKRVNTSIYKSANSPISGMLTDHDKGQAYLKKLDALTHHYAAPVEEGNAFKVTYAAMRALEQDLHTHIMLESEVLFPRAVEMEIRVSDLTYPTLPVS